MILVTGATGHLGKATISHLLKNTNAGRIAALARDEQKAAFLKEKGVEVRLGDFDDTASLDKAVQGVSKVLLISGADPNRLQQHKNLVDSAVKAGVKHIAYTGVSLHDVNSSALAGLMKSHFQTEDYIRENGLTYTFLRNSLYADIIPMYVGKNVFETGVVLPAGTGKVPFALRAEMGEAAANILLQEGHENKTYHITGRELYSFDDVTRELSALSGKSLTYTDPDPAAYEEMLTNSGVSGFLVSLISGFAADIRNKQYEIVSDDLQKLLGRKPAALDEALRVIYHPVLNS